MSDEPEQMKRIGDEARDRTQERRPENHGLFIVHTGLGKGKTTAAVGMVLRCLGHGFRVGVVQFGSATPQPVEARLLPELFSEQVDWYRMRTVDEETRQKPEQTHEGFKDAWKRGQAMLSDPDYDFVLLDELTAVLRDELIDPENVLKAVRNRPEGQHVTVTGRDLPDLLVGGGDMVTEMQPIRHFYKDRDAKAQAGIEY